MAKTTEKELTITELSTLLKSKRAKWSIDKTLLTDKNSSILKKYTLGSNRPKKNALTASLPQIRSNLKTIKAFSARDKILNLRKLPNQWDWRNVEGKSYVSSVKNQGGCGSCVAFATAAAIESHYLIENKKNVSNEMLDLSEASLFFTAQRQCNVSDKNYGWWINESLEAAMNEGVCLEKDYPYEPKNQTATILNGNVRTLKIRGYDSTTNTTTMKRWLVEQGPLIANFDVYDDFRSFFHASNLNEVYNHVDSTTRSGSHAVCVIGYNDQKSAWICKNSWGATEHLPDGCFLIGYNECGIDDRMYVPQGVYDVYTVDTICYDPNNLQIIKESNTQWLLTDGKSRMKIFASSEDARNGLRIARRHTRHCFVGRNNNRENRKDFIFEFWEGSSGLTYEPLSKYDVITYDPTKVVAIYNEKAKYWQIIENNSHYMFIADDMNDAMAILSVVKCYHRLCFIGRSNRNTNRKDYIMSYFE